MINSLLNSIFSFHLKHQLLLIYICIDVFLLIENKLILMLVLKPYTFSFYKKPVYKQPSSRQPRV